MSHLTRRDFLAAAATSAAGAVFLGCAGGPPRPQAAATSPAPGPAPAPAMAPTPAPVPAADPVVAPVVAPAPARFAALAGFCQGIAPPDEHELAERRERGRKLLRDAGLAALILEAGSTLTYFTGGRWGLSERPLLYILPVTGEPVWIGPAFEEGTLRQSFVGQSELRVWHEHESPYARAAQVLAERRVLRGRVAVDPAMRLFVHDGLRRASPRLGFDSGGAVVDECRMIKTTAELARLRRANEATKAALAAAAAHLAPGMTEAEFVALVREAQEAAGLASIWALVLFGANAAHPHGMAGQRRLAEGDLVLVDTGGSLHGYRSDITRTWAFGAPGDEQRRAWDVVLAAQTAALDMLRPGVTCGEVDAAARAIIDRAGHGSDYQRFTHRLGHGIGLDVHEQPYLVRASQRVLRPGMTMSNEPGIYIPGAFGIRIEDIVAITETGHELFGPRAHSLEQPFGSPA